jgi:tetratricopeptide (TPR) repeat protein
VTTSLLDGLDLTMDPMSSREIPAPGAAAPVAPDLDAVLSDNLMGEASLSWTQPPVAPSPGESASAPFPNPAAPGSRGGEPSGTDWMVDGLNLDLSLPDMTGESMPTGRAIEPDRIRDSLGTETPAEDPGPGLDLSMPAAGGGLELDIGEVRARAEPASDVGPSTVVGSTSPAGSPSIAPIVAVARKGGTTAKRGLPKPLLVGATLICLVGVILGQTDYGYFGMNLLFPPQTGRGGAGRPTAPRSGGVVGTGLDSLLKETDRLENQIQQDPENAGLRDDLLDVLLRISERYPNQMTATPRFAQRTRELQAQMRPGGSRGERLVVATLLLDRKFDEARKALDGMLAATPQDPDVLFLLGRAALGQEKPDEAQRFLEQSLDKAPGIPSTKYLLGEALRASKQTARAKVVLEEVLAEEPDHIGARAALAATAVAVKDFETATKYSQEVVSKGNPAQWREETVLAHEVLAEVYLARNEPAKRLEELVAALAIQPDREATAVTVSRLYQEARKRDQALAILEPCREKGCAGEEFLRTYAFMAFLNDREEAAEKAIKDGAEKYPKSPGFALLRAQHQIDLGRPRVAVSVLEDALKVDAAPEEVYVLLSKALVKDGKLSAAVDRLKAGLEQVKDTRPLLAALADVHRTQRDYPAAEVVLRKLIGFGGAEVQAQQALGLMVAAQGRAGEAVRILGALEGKGSLDREGILGYADALLATNEKQRAYEVLGKLFARNENDPVVGSAYGHALAEGGKTPQGEEILRKVIELVPSFSQAYYNLGRLYRKIGEKPRAVEVLTRAVQLENTNTVYRLELARAHLDLGTTDGRRDARMALDAVATAYGRGDVPLEFQDAEVFVLRGRMQFEDQKYSVAMKDFEAALTLSPSRLDVMISFGRSLFEMTRYKEAEPYFRQVLVRDNLHPEANYFLGRILLREHDSEGAKTHLSRAVQRDTRLFPDAHRLLGLLYNDQGIRPLARKELEIFVAIAQKGTPEYEEAKGILDRMR